MPRTTAPGRPTAPGPRRFLVPLLSTALVALLAGTWLLSGALVAGTDPLLVAAGRSGVCCAVLAAFAAARPTARAQMRRLLARPGEMTYLALLGFALYAACTLLAIGRVGTSLTNTVVALMPCAALAVGALCHGERAGPRRTLGACLATLATAAYALSGSSGGQPGRTDLVGVLLAVAAVLGFAVYGFRYRARLPGVEPLAALPVLLGAATALLLPLALAAPGATAAQWAGIAVLGGAVYAPAYLLQHRLILLRGPVFTASVQLAVPFSVRIGSWATGASGPPSALELGLLACALAGIGLVTTTTGTGAAAKPRTMDRLRGE
ncbi:EamA family transporter [Streptomyces sp. NPDC004111]|uniref:EamA family transporter n=1 Tax=Streptomyces sp. NPDC004111 TaxID=3364690 RepID=UPI0036A1743D